MAEGSPQCRTYSCIPDVYVLEPSTGSWDTADCGRQQHAGPGDCRGPSRKEQAGTGGDPREDLVEEGFIPFNELKLEDLPPDIRTRENLEHILRIGERVVRINNYKLSEERNKNEEMKMPGRSLQGSGFAFYLKSLNDIALVMVFTNQHVLYNEEELFESNIDFFFDSYGGRRQSREWKRTQRGSGCLMSRQNSSADFCVVSYISDPATMTSLEHLDPCLRLLYRLPNTRKRGRGKRAESDEKDIVCVISHPLSRSKHVSFGKIVEWNLEKKTFFYDAPTKPGSSGCPIIIFTRGSLLIDKGNLFYHEGTDRRTGLKIGHVESFEMTLPRMPIDFKVYQSRKRSFPAKLEERFSQHLTKLSLEEVRRQTQIEVSTSLLAAFLPIFAAFVLQPQKYCSSVQRLQQARPCQKLSQADVQLTREDEALATSWISYWLKHSSSVFPDLTEQGEGEVPSLSPLLTSETPCWCQAIVDAVVQHTASENEDSGDCFLRPDAVQREFPLPKTWPWSRDTSQGCLRPGREPMLKHCCLLKECLDVFRKAVNERDHLLWLLVLIRKANLMLRQPLSETSRVKKKNSDSREKTEATAADHTESPLTEARALNSVDPSNSKREPEADFPDVGRLLIHAAVQVSIVRLSMMNLPMHVNMQKFPPKNPGEDIVKNYYSTVDLVGHMTAHYIREHPDHSSSQGDLSSPPDCPCGSPPLVEVVEALKLVCMIRASATQAKQSALGEKQQSPKQTPSHIEPPILSPNIYKMNFFVSYLLTKVHEECSSAYKDSPCPLEEFLGRIDTLDNFRTSKDLLSVSVTSPEVFLFNTRHLLRQCHQLVSPLYISGPVSLFGRPGRWPAGVTPMAVKDTAWKLIRAACGKSSFGRDFLKVLEQDEDRREKLIDWYVDMKQLKFAGDIEKEAFDRERLLLDKKAEDVEHFHLDKEARDRNCFLSSLAKNKLEREGLWPHALSENPTQFVMRTFLALVEPLRPRNRVRLGDSLGSFLWFNHDK